MEGASSAISGQLDVMDGLTQQFEQLLAKPKDEEREGLGRQVTVIFDERCLLHINPFQHFEQVSRDGWSDPPDVKRLMARPPEINPSFHGMAD